VVFIVLFIVLFRAKAFLFLLPVAELSTEKVSKGSPSQGLLREDMEAEARSGCVGPSLSTLGLFPHLKNEVIKLGLGGSRMKSYLLRRQKSGGSKFEASLDK
jgi:hypothetical protein